METARQAPRRSGNVRRSSGRSEEFQRDVVRVSERKTRAIGRIHDPTGLDAQLTQLGCPLFEFAAVRARECEVVESDASLIEGFGAAVGKLMQAHQRLADRPHDVTE